MNTTLTITGMHCQACVRRVTEALRAAPGITSATVTLNPPQAVVESPAPVSIDTLAAAVSTAGKYTVTLLPPSPAPSGGGVTSLRVTEGVRGGEDEGGVSPPAPSLYPLFLIVTYIAGATALTTFLRGDSTFHSLMLDFMAGFFLVFSFFKLLDLHGFADAYQSYDLLARRSRAYAFAYPFLELVLGVAYLIRWQPTLTNAVTLALMLLGSVGVLKALLDKRHIRCACLGTALNLPMTTVTLVEDLGMAAMAAAALLWPQGV